MAFSKNLNFTNVFDIYLFVRLKRRLLSEKKISRENVAGHPSHDDVVLVFGGLALLCTASTLSSSHFLYSSQVPPPRRRAAGRRQANAARAGSWSG